MDVAEVQKRKGELESKIHAMLTDFITQTGVNIIGTRAVFGDASRINSFLIETSI